MLLQTYTGRMVDLADPRPEMIDIVDIAHHLAIINRFNGATIRPYSVAEHSLRVAYILHRVGMKPTVVMAGLLHDAAEAYLGDDTRPKRVAVASGGGGLEAVHRYWESLIWDTFGIAVRPGDTWPQNVRYADDLLLQFEAQQLLPGGWRETLDPVKPPEGVTAFDPYDPAFNFPGEFRCLHWGDASRLFLMAFDRLRRGECLRDDLFPWAGRSAA